MDIDRRAFIASLGGTATVGLMSDEAKADALEEFMMRELDAAVAQTQQGSGEKFPSVADLEAQIESRSLRRGVGNLFVARTGNVKRLPAMPARPTLMDFFRLRFMATSNHVLQSATRALKTGMSEEIVLACLLHDVVQEIIKVDHGWWGAQLFEPYISERATFAIRFRQALRFYADPANGYEYPDLYRRVFGHDYRPEAYIEATYQMVRKHRWYDAPRMVTVNDLYAFDPNAKVELAPFEDIIGRHFKQPKEGLGNDNTASGHAALTRNTNGNRNTATGYQAMFNNIVGINNAAFGADALQNVTGSNNVALGNLAGFNATTGSNNIYIGAGVQGVAGESDAMYLGGTQTKTVIAGVRGTTVTSGEVVVIDAAGRLGSAAVATGADTVGSAQVIDESLTASDLGPNSVSTSELAAGQHDRSHPGIL